MSLYERLQRLEKGTVERAVNVLETSSFNPAEDYSEMPYLKDDLAAAILGDLELRGISVMNAKTMYGTLNKEPMKRIYYGLMLLHDMPDEFMQALHDDSFTNWMESYFAVGAWARFNPLGGSRPEPRLRMPIGYKTMSLPELIREYVGGGLNRLGTEHYRRKKQGEYKAHQQPPFDSQIRKELNKSAEEAKKGNAPTIEQILKGEKPRARPVNLRLF